MDNASTLAALARLDALDADIDAFCARLDDSEDNLDSSVITELLRLANDLNSIPLPNV